MARVRLVVRGVDHCGAVGLEPVAKRETGMVHIACSDAGAAGIEAALPQIVKAQGGAELAETDGEVRVLHLPGHGCLEPLADTFRRVDVPLVPGCEEGREEGKALDVVPVGMRDEQMTADRAGRRRDQVAAQLMGAGAAVQDDERAVRGADLDARGIAAVPQGRRTGLGDRASRAPEADPHAGERSRERHVWSSAGEDVKAGTSGACGFYEGLSIRGCAVRLDSDRSRKP